MVSVQHLTIVSVIGAAMALSNANTAVAGIDCTHERCMELINEIARKKNPNLNLVAKKQSCGEEKDGSTSCRYRSAGGPGINFVTNAGSKDIQAVVMVDVGGLSPAGGVYIDLMMEAFDKSLDDEGRKKLFNALINKWFEKSSANVNRDEPVVMQSGELQYVLTPGQDLTIFGISRANQKH
jgi:hypothetical protein